MSVFKQLFNKDLYYLPFGDSFVFSTECEKNLKMKSFACFFLDFAFVSAFLAFISFSRCWHEQVGSFVKKCSSVSWEKCPESNYLENVIYCSKCQNDAMFHIVISRITINLPLKVLSTAIHISYAAQSHLMDIPNMTNRTTSIWASPPHLLDGNQENKNSGPSYLARYMRAMNQKAKQKLL